MRDHHKIVHTMNLIKEHMEDLQRHMDVLADELKQVESEMILLLWLTT